MRQRKRDRDKKGGQTGRERQRERGRLVESKEMGKMKERWGDCKREFFNPG